MPEIEIGIGIPIPTYLALRQLVGYGISG